MDKSITWQMLPEIVDLIANNTESDEEFRLQLWALFGVHMYAPMNKLLVDTNRGLSLELHNSGPRYVSDKPKFSQERTSNIPEDNEKRSILYNNTQRRGPQEQFHHYLGAVTGERHRLTAPQKKIHS